jgi:hypothetical protein
MAGPLHPFLREGWTPAVLDLIETRSTLGATHR